MRYILDCSVAVKWFLPEPLSEQAGRLLRQLEANQVSFIAPESMVAEFGHALRKHVLGARITAEESHILVDEFLGLGIDLVPIAPLASHAMRLTTLYTSTFYDALYVCLAIREDLRVLTADEGMVSAFAPLKRTLWLGELTP